MSLVNVKCPNCGASIQLDDSRAEGFCSYCGSKVRLEEAKKLTIQGTVKVDSSDELANLYQIARRAKDSNNSENAAKYYEMILVKDPNSWEANFYTVYFKAMSCKIGQIFGEADNVNNCIKPVFELIKANVKDANEQQKAVVEGAIRTLSLAQMLYNAALNHFQQFMSVQGQADESVNTLYACGKIAYTIGDEIYANFDSSLYKDLIIKAWSQGIDCNRNSSSAYSMARGNILQPQNSIAEQYRSKIQQLDPSVTPPAASSGCMVLLVIAMSPFIALLGWLLCN